MSHDPRVSHGRGGAGNIERDDQTYVDGEIVREGPVGDQGDGAYSAGRGGAGNIESPSIQPRKGSPRGDVDVVPETATRPGPRGNGYESFHTGIGGGGNVYREKRHDEQGKEVGEGKGQGEGKREGQGKGKEGLMGKARHLFGGGK